MLNHDRENLSPHVYDSVQRANALIYVNQVAVPGRLVVEVLGEGVGGVFTAIIPYVYLYIFSICHKIANTQNAMTAVECSL